MCINTVEHAESMLHGDVYKRQIHTLPAFCKRPSTVDRLWCPPVARNQNTRNRIPVIVPKSGSNPVVFLFTVRCQGEGGLPRLFLLLWRRLLSLLPSPWQFPCSLLSPFSPLSCGTLSIFMKPIFTSVFGFSGCTQDFPVSYTHLARLANSDDPDSCSCRSHN